MYGEPRFVQADSEAFSFLDETENRWIPCLSDNRGFVVFRIVSCRTERLIDTRAGEQGGFEVSTEIQNRG